MRKALAALALLVVALAVPPLEAALNKPRQARFQASRALPQNREQILEIIQRVMEETVKIDRLDPEAAQVVSRWYYHKVGPSQFRTRVTAVVIQRSGGNVVEVRAQREILMEALSPGTMSPGQKWQMVGSHEAIAEDLLERIERAAGVWVDPEEEALRAAATQAVEEVTGAGAPPPAGPEAWKEIQRLKEERRALLQPVRALDEKALEIVYSGDAATRQAELDEIREERNSLWERTRPRIMALDKRILELVLAE